MDFNSTHLTEDHQFKHRDEKRLNVFVCPFIRMRSNDYWKNNNYGEIIRIWFANIHQASVGG